MANALYDNYRNIAFGAGTNGPVDLDGDTITVYLMDNADYTYSAAHTSMTQLTSGGRVANVALSSKTVGTVGVGVFDSADPTFTSVTGDQSESLVIVKSTGTDSTSPLIAYYDTFSSGMPVTPSGGNISIAVSASGWFSF